MTGVAEPSRPAPKPGPGRVAQKVVESAGLGIVLGLPVFFNPYSVSPFEGSKVLFFRSLVWLMLAVFTLDRLLRRRAAPTHRKDPLFWPVLAYGGTFILATAFSLDFRRSLWGGDEGHGTITALTALAFFFLMARVMRSEYQVERLTSALLLSPVAVVAYGLVQLVGLDPLSWSTDSISPVSSTLGRSNFLGAYLALVVPFVLYRWSLESNNIAAADNRAELRLFCWKSRFAALFLLLVICVLFTQARAAWLSLMTGVLVFTGLVSTRWPSRRFIVATAVFLVAGMAILPLLHYVDLTRSSTLPGRVTFSELRAGTVASRLDIWRATVELIPNHWLVGHGPQTFGGVLIRSYQAGVLVDDPHNIILDHLVENGLLGLFAYFAVLGMFYAQTLRAVAKTAAARLAAFLAAAAGSVSAFVVQALFNPDFIVAWVLFWLVLAMASVTRDPDIDNEEEQGPSQRLLFASVVNRAAKWSSDQLGW